VSGKASSKNLLETVMGAVVIAVAAGFLVFAYEKSNMASVEGYTVNARFGDITGVSAGSDVRIGGVKVGAIEEIKLDPETYTANVVMRVKEKLSLPKDSSVSVVSSGLLGDKYIRIEPGAEETMLEEGDTIEYTQSSISFEDLIGRYVFSGGGVDSGSSDASPSGSEDDDTPDNPASLGL